MFNDEWFLDVSLLIDHNYPTPYSSFIHHFLIIKVYKSYSYKQSKLYCTIIIPSWIHSIVMLRKSSWSHNITSQLDSCIHYIAASSTNNDVWTGIIFSAPSSWHLLMLYVCFALCTVPQISDPRPQMISINCQSQMIPRGKSEWLGLKLLDIIEQRQKWLNWIIFASQIGAKKKRKWLWTTFKSLLNQWNTNKM